MLKRVVIVLILVTVLAIAMFSALFQTSQAAAPELRWNIGVARPIVADGAWAFVNSPPHVSQGFGAPVCNAAGTLSIPYLSSLTTIAGSAVMTDEDWSRAGIVAGASVGVDHVYVYFTQFTRNGPVALACSEMDAIGNVWIQVEGT